MIQFNLLPAVKLEFVKARRIKRLLTLISLVASGIALVLLLLAIVSVDVVQKKSIRDLNSDISTYSTKLKAVPSLDKILTVQNQLNTLTSLHDQKAVASRLFGYVAQVTPAQASLNKLTVDFAQHTITLGGTAPTLATISTYTDTLKATTYTTTSNSAATKAFSSVVLSSFGLNNSATFTITMNFDAAIFDSKSDVKLTVPTTTTGNQTNLFGIGN